MVMWLIAACAKTAAPTVADMPVPDDPCMAECSQRHMAKAVEADLVMMECRMECAARGGADWQAAVTSAPSTSLSDTARWYGQVLGFQVRLTEGAPRKALLERPGVVLELVEAEGMVDAVPVVFEVPDLDLVLRNVHAQLLVEPVEEIEHDGRRGVQLVAPDGAIVRLVSQG